MTPWLVNLLKSALSNWIEISYKNSDPNEIMSTHNRVVFALTFRFSRIVISPNQTKTDENEFHPDQINKMKQTLLGCLTKNNNKTLCINHQSHTHKAHPHANRNVFSCCCLLFSRANSHHHSNFYFRVSHFHEWSGKQQTTARHRLNEWVKFQSVCLCLCATK